MKWKEAVMNKTRQGEGKFVMQDCDETGAEVTLTPKMYYLLSSGQYQLITGTAKYHLTMPSPSPCHYVMYQ